MINFILCDDNKFVQEINERVISKVAMPYDFNYTVHTFDKYDINFKKIITDPSSTKIYILDLEMPGKSGLDIAREIRKYDWNSIIIILTSHDELELKMLKEKLLIFDFISKFDKPELKLEETLKLVLNKLSSTKLINFKSNKEIHQLPVDDIYYIYKDNFMNKTVIVTNSEEFPVNDTLGKLYEKLDKNFIRTHRSCYVNLNKIKSVDFNNNIIYFDNKKKIDLLSRNYKKELRDRL